VFGKYPSFSILPFYKLKVTEIKTLKIILIHLFFKTESSAQSHKILANNPGSFCTVFYTGFALFCWSVGPQYRYSQWKCHIT